MVTFAAQNFTDTCMDSSTFCSDNYFHNSKSDEYFLIRSRNKIENILPKHFLFGDSVCYASSPQDYFSPVIPSGITSMIPMETNYNIPFSDILPISPRNWSKIPEDTYPATFYKFTSSAPTNSKIHLINPYSTTSIKSNSDSTFDSIPPLKLSNSNTHQQNCSHIFNDKQDPKDLKRYYGNEKHWHKAKETWASAISAAQCDFMLKSDYVHTDKSDTYACNKSDLADGYIFKILYLNLPTSNSHQWRNALERFHNRDKNEEVFITYGRGV